MALELLDCTATTITVGLSTTISVCLPVNRHSATSRTSDPYSDDGSRQLCCDSIKPIQSSSEDIMKYQSLHRGLSKVSLLRIPLIIFITLGGTGLGAYLLHPAVMSADLALLTSLVLSVIGALKAAGSLKGVPTEHLHFEGSDMYWSIEQGGELLSEKISLIGLKVKKTSLDYIDIETAEGQSHSLHVHWLIVENNESDASFCVLKFTDDGAVMHGFKTLGKNTRSIGNIDEINIKKTEDSEDSNNQTV